ncbi:MAG: DUF6261 family protein [Mangrovibacterium sp.]
MTSITKIRNIGTARLNNAEYLAFMTGVRKLIDKATPEKLMVDSETLTAFDAGLNQLTDLMIKLRGNEETAQMAELDNERDRLVRYLMVTVRYASKSPITEHQEAGAKLWLLLQPYRNMAQLPNGQETERVEGLLYDFAKPEYAPHVTALGLDVVATELSSINTQYKEMSLARTESRTVEALETGREIRLRVDEQYDRIQSLAFVAMVANPSPEADEFAAGLNQLISETKTLYRLRLSQKKERKQKKNSQA